MKVDVNSITAIFTVVISIISLVFSITFAKKQEKFNRNSIMPVCNIIFNDYKNKIAVKIRNVGPGVATINSFNCSSDDSGINYSSLIEVFGQDIRIKDDDNIVEAGEWTDFIENIEGRSIGSGEELVLLCMENSTPQIMEEIRYNLRPLQISLTYCDVYGTVFSTHRDLEWFGRNLHD